MKVKNTRGITKLSSADSSSVHSTSAPAKLAIAELYSPFSDTRREAAVKVETKNARKPSNDFVLVSLIQNLPNLLPTSHANVSPMPIDINPASGPILLFP